MAEQSFPPSSPPPLMPSLRVQGKERMLRPWQDEAGGLAGMGRGGGEKGKGGGLLKIPPCAGGARRAGLRCAVSAPQCAERGAPQACSARCWAPPAPAACCWVSAPPPLYRDRAGLSRHPRGSRRAEGGGSGAGDARWGLGRARCFIHPPSSPQIYVPGVLGPVIYLEWGWEIGQRAWVCC